MSGSCVIDGESFSKQLSFCKYRKNGTTDFNETVHVFLCKTRVWMLWASVECVSILVQKLPQLFVL